MNLIYIARPDSAFDSQVKNLLNILSKDINRIILIIPFDIRNFLLCSRTNDVVKKFNSNIEIVYIKYIPFLNRYSAILNAFLIRKIIKNIFRNININKTVVHTRGYLWGYIINKTLNSLNLKIPLLVDFRGVGWKEIQLYNTKLSNYRSKQLKIIEKMTFKNSTAISVVSNAFKDYLVSEYGNRDNIFINHCVVKKKLFSYNLLENKRDKTRKKIGVSKNDIIIIFSTGAASKWQNIKKIIKDFKSINNRINNTFKFLLITKNKVIINKYKKNQNIITLSLKHEEMGKYLVASDIAIIEREKNLVNKIACPIKFGEYLVSGLPVISNDSVEIITKIIDKFKVGLIEKNIINLNKKYILNLIKIDRQKISKIGLKKFDLEITSKKYLEIYNKIIYH